MGELGEQGEDLHKQIGSFTKETGVDFFFAVGGLTAQSVKTFGADGRHFYSIEDLVVALKPQLDSNTTVLVKGSRFMQMERVVEALSQKQNQLHATEDH
jgi:UDP-N-acetylmuramoyl-tripeptide--D-alanyl-D-alanine ligase